jgi:hypothetical protein
VAEAIGLLYSNDFKLLGSPSEDPVGWSLSEELFQKSLLKILNCVDKVDIFLIIIEKVIEKGFFIF